MPRHETSPAYRHSPLEHLLKAVEYFHGRATIALAGPKPDPAAAKRYMAKAQKIGKVAAQYLSNVELRRRIVADQPMSEADWATIGLAGRN